MSEIPVHSRPRRLAEWLNPTGARKVHSLIDKVYQRKNLQMAWGRVRANRGSGGVDGQSLEAYGAQLDQQLDRLRQELKEESYQLVGLEQTTHSESLYDFHFERRTALVVGNERLGLTEDELAMVDRVAEIPVFGLPYAYNVHTSVAMAVYEYCRQYPRG